jgi:Zn-dependent peptidase ImmA (M78 family)
VARRPNRAEQAAIDLLEELGIDEPPIHVDGIADQLSVSLRYEPLEGGLSGVLFRDHGGRQVIGVNSSHAQVRQRFTIAHELGHLRLHEDALYVDGLVRRDDKSSLALDYQEIEANAFAAELLMPRKLVLRELGNTVPEGAVADPTKLLRRLARQFDVSEQAMEFRLVNLGVATSF